MPLRIAAICATPRNRNTGMRCVDRALQMILERSDLRAEVDFFCFDLPDYVSADGHGPNYKPIMEFGEVTDYGAIIIWGDFILTKTWLTQIITKIAKDPRHDKTAVHRKIEEILFPLGRSLDWPPVIVFGQSLTVDSSEIFSDESYIEGLCSLLSRAELALMRDPISAYRASAITGLSASRFTGIDAALLLSAFDANKDVGVAAGGVPVEIATRRAGLFFGRTHGVGAIITQLALAASLRRVRDLRPVWIPWFPLKQMPSWIAKVFGVRETLVCTSLDDYIQAVRSCRLILTDTYHLALVSWSHGVPAICIGKGAQHFRKTIHDKKKEIFFISNYLDEFYLFTEKGLGNFVSGTTHRAIAHALDPKIGSRVRARLSSAATENIRLLLSIFDRLST